MHTQIPKIPTPFRVRDHSVLVMAINLNENTEEMKNGDGNNDDATKKTTTTTSTAKTKKIECNIKRKSKRQTTEKNQASTI